jgi:hypothetical protein
VHASLEAKKAADRAYYEANREEIRRKQIDVRYRLRYGITLAEYEQILAGQDGRCAICGTEEPGGRGNRFHVDHDHETGIVRGLLCWTCNRRLGVLECAEFMGPALAYLSRIRAQ